MTTNPTAAEFAAMLDACENARRALNATQDEAAYDRTAAAYRDAFQAVRNARPADPKSLARHLRWFLEEAGVDLDDRPLLINICERLEAIDLE